MGNMDYKEKALISKYLDKKKIKHSLSGRDYLIEAIHISLSIKGIVKITMLYAEIGRRFDTTAAKVERDIRHAILTRKDCDHIINSEFVFIARDDIELSAEYQQFLSGEAGVMQHDGSGSVEREVRRNENFKRKQPIQ